MQNYNKIVGWAHVLVGAEEGMIGLAEGGSRIRYCPLHKMD